MSWTPRQFVPTAAANMLLTLAAEKAGSNQVVGVTARQSFGKSFLAQHVRKSGATMGIKNRIAYVEFWAEEETNAALRRIAVEVGWGQEDVRTMGASHLFDCIVEYIHRHKIDLMLVDNAHYLPSDVLSLVGQLSSTFPRSHGLARLPNELILPIEEGMRTQCSLGVSHHRQGFP